jgi:hypothetical protein
MTFASSRVIPGKTCPAVAGAGPLLVVTGVPGPLLKTSGSADSTFHDAVLMLMSPSTGSRCSTSFKATTVESPAVPPEFDTG